MVESSKVFQSVPVETLSEVRSFRVSRDKCCPDMPRLNFWVADVWYEVRMKLLGRVKNAVKSTAQPDLFDAVQVRGHESWWLLEGKKSTYWKALMNQFSRNLMNYMVTQQI